MKKIFSLMNPKAMLQINIGSIVVTAICELFALGIFFTKGQTPDLVHWKYVVIVLGLAVISLLFLGSIASLILFIRMKNKKK